MTSDRLRGFLRLGIFALLVFGPLPFGSVQPEFVLAIELIAAALGLAAILLIGRDDDARAAMPTIPLVICGVAIALGIFQLAPLPFSIAQRFNPTAELVRPLIPYLGLDRPPKLSWSLAAPETTDALFRFIAYVLIGLAAAVAFDTERSRRRFAFVLVAAAVFQAVYGSGEYLSGRQHIFGFAKRYYLESATGTLINRNHFATLLAIALPFALVLSIPGATSSRKARAMSWRERFVRSTRAGELGRMLAVAAAALIWLGLLLSHSRAGLIAAGVGAAIVLVRFRATRAARWTGAVGAGVLLLLLTIDLAQIPGERFFTLKEEIHGSSGRPAVWRDALRLARARPVLGWGYGTFESAFPMVHSAAIDLHYDHAHSDWIEWTTEGGLLALGVAILLLGFAFRNTRAGVLGTGTSDAVLVACRAAIAAVALHAAWDFSLRIPAVAAMGAALMGLASSGRATEVAEHAATGVFPAERTARDSGNAR